MTPELLSALRSILIVAGGGLVTHGYVDDSGLQAIVGGILALAAAAWGIWAKRPQSSEAQKVAQSVVDAPNVPSPLNAAGQEVK
jgi:hypothetical protein